MEKRELGRRIKMNPFKYLTVIFISTLCFISFFSLNFAAQQVPSSEPLLQKPLQPAQQLALPPYYIKVEDKTEYYPNDYTLIATLKARAGAPDANVGNKMIVFRVNGIIVGQSTTDSGGTANLLVPYSQMNLQPGTYPIEAFLKQHKGEPSIEDHGILTIKKNEVSVTILTPGIDMQKGENNLFLFGGYKVITGKLVPRFGNKMVSTTGKVECLINGKVVTQATVSPDGTVTCAIPLNESTLPQVLCGIYVAGTYNKHIKTYNPTFSMHFYGDTHYEPNSYAGWFFFYVCPQGTYVTLVPSFHNWMCCLPIGLTPCPLLTLVSAPSLASAQVGKPYSFQLQSSGGQQPIKFELILEQHLPPGLVLHSNGLISGTPTNAGSYSFGITVRDNCPYEQQFQSNVFFLTVQP